jgi:agmatine deiminase
MMKEFSLPPEWDKQDAILITWPHLKSAWASKIEIVELTYIQITTVISHYQPLIIQLHSSIDLDSVVRRLSLNGSDISNCHFIQLDSDDTWARDHGPITITNGDDTRCLNFIFNGWGNKFQHTKDNALNSHMNKNGLLNNMQEVDWVLEGGSIEVDEYGVLLTTSQCVLNSNRNGKTLKENLTSRFHEWVKVNKVIYIENGSLEGDDTDSHIDTLARFAPTNQIIFQGCSDESDPHFLNLKEMKSELGTIQNSFNQPYKLIELPLPKAIYAEDGHRLPATYANFLITNKNIIVPTYDDAADSIAIELIKDAFPEHIVVGVNALSLIEEHGSIHCITMQLPKGSVNFDYNFTTPKTTGY